MSSDHRIVDKLKMPPEAQDALVRAVPDEVVRGIVSDYVKPAATSEPTKTIVDQLVEKFGPRSGLTWSPPYQWDLCRRRKGFRC